MDLARKICPRSQYLMSSCLSRRNCITLSDFFHSFPSYIDFSSQSIEVVFDRC